MKITEIIDEIYRQGAKRVFLEIRRGKITAIYYTGNISPEMTPATIRIQRISEEVARKWMNGQYRNG